MSKMDYSKEIEDLYQVKMTMGVLDLNKFNNLISQIEGVEDKFNSLKELVEIKKLKLDEQSEDSDDFNKLNQLLELNSRLILKLHMEIGNLLSQLEFKINQSKIRLKLERIKNPQNGHLNLSDKIYFDNLDNQIKTLIDISYRLCVEMKNLIYIDILNNKEDKLNDLENIEKSIDNIIDEKNNYNFY